MATIYNDQNNSVWTSKPFQVADGSGWLDPTTTTDINGNTPTGSMIFHDALGRVIATQDPNWGSPQEPGISCSTVLSGTYTTCMNYSWGTASGTDDTTIYAVITGVDANGHVTQSDADVLGQTVYTTTNTGIYGGTLTPNRLTYATYNALGKPTQVAVADEQAPSGASTAIISTTMTYDDLGRLVSETDPDQGTFTATYDPDGQILSVVQTSGSSSRTMGTNYDLLGRVGCEQTAAPTINWNGACSAGNPLVQNTYDVTKIGTQGSTDFPVGRLTQSVATTYFPDSTSATVTEQFQYDQRGRPVTAQMAFGLPSSWSVTTALPTDAVTQAYNDADQPTTTSTSANGLGYTFTNVYDSGNGALQGLSSNSSSTANLATVAYNANALLSQVNFATSTGSSGLATEQFSYDGDLRPTTISAIWASGSGQSGSLFSQTRSYDNAGNVTSLTTTQAQVQGQSTSGGSQTENYCYDEQNRLIWAGNGGTQPGAGNGTCGSGTLGNSLSRAGYTSGYSYTNLGQIWTGPTAGSQSSQYLYCDSSHPHQLTGIYPTGTTCSNKSSATAIYSASYDAWGNITTRSFNNVTAALSYDTLNHMVQWSDGNSNQEQYVYDAGGDRVLKRSTSGGVTTMTIYAFGLQELHYHGDGTPVGGTSNSYYYSLGGLLLGKSDGINTTFFITDGLGSVVTSFSNTANSAAVLGNQTYEPYGKAQYQQGSMGTSKGYTGQQNDNLSGLDYYGARYYDPVAGIFLSPDSVQGNTQAMDPYAYVAGNPETLTDPTGLAPIPPPCKENCATAKMHRDIQNFLNSTNKTINQAANASNTAQASAAFTALNALWAVGLSLIGTYGPDLSVLAALTAIVFSESTLHMRFPYAQSNGESLGAESSKNGVATGTAGASSPSSDPFVGNEDFPVPTPIDAPGSDSSGATGIGGDSSGATGIDSDSSGGNGPIVITSTPDNYGCRNYESAVQPPKPPILEGMTKNSEFGNMIEWGKSAATGQIDSLNRIYTITPENLAEWQARGLTQEIVQKWVDFYQWAAKYKQPNPTALGRAPLMMYICQLLGGYVPPWW